MNLLIHNNNNNNNNNNNDNNNNDNNDSNNDDNNNNNNISSNLSLSEDDVKICQGYEEKSLRLLSSVLKRWKDHLHPLCEKDETRIEVERQAWGLPPSSPLVLYNRDEDICGERRVFSRRVKIPTLGVRLREGDVYM